MSDRTHLVELIEQAERQTPVCAACREIPVPTIEDGALWLECPTLTRRRSWFRQLVSLDFEAAHTHQLLLEPGWDAALAA